MWSEEASEEGSEVGSEESEGGQGEGCSAVTKSLYTYGFQDRVLYDFCPASGRLVVATPGEIRVMDFLVPVPDSCVSFSFFDLGLKVDNFSFKCMIPLYDSESFPPLTLLFNQLCIKILTCMYVCLLENHLQGSSQDGIKIDFDLLEIRKWSVWGWSGMETASIRCWYGRAEGGV